MTVVEVTTHSRATLGRPPPTPSDPHTQFQQVGSPLCCGAMTSWLGIPAPAAQAVTSRGQESWRLFCSGGSKVSARRIEAPVFVCFFNWQECEVGGLTWRITGDGNLAVDRPANVQARANVYLL